jgi:hypothetical protein
LQLGTRDGWTAFLAQYPEGFYSGLAKGQLNKIAAEEARTAAAEKARLAEEEKARLAADRAKKTEQDKAAATARAAENARVVAEKAKELEEAKTAAAEQRRKEIEAAVAKALADKQAAEKKDSLEADQKIAALSSPAPSPEPAQSLQELATSVQSELRRVGCFANSENGEWSAKSQRSLALFNKYAGTKLDTNLATLGALDAIKAKPGRVCPLVCDHGFKADGDACVKIACRAGYRVNDDNECEKVRDKKPVATQDDAKRDQQRRQAETAPSKPQASGQVVCNQGGCRPVRSGCRLAFGRNGTNMASGAYSQSYEVCN